ncbi:MAG: biotin--[acetyl-CoA-carboxylase] ligase [Phycisphaerales bacterium]|nr:biotin--[acetyl-CoA-carboxylase] ligase [Phycisphaerales bacterium]
MREQLHAGSTRPIEVHACVTSTQDAARAFIAQHGVKSQGAIFLADEQTHGRGRLGRRWLAPPGKCLLLTYVFILQAHDNKTLEMLSLSAAVCIAEALESVAKPAPLTVGIKWPNDLLVRGAKIAGLLLESVALGADHRAVMLGIGINVAVNADELPRS